MTTDRPDVATAATESTSPPAELPQEQRRRPELVKELRIKVPLPVVIPLAALLVIALPTFGLSRVLLHVSKEAAIVVAMVIATTFLGAAAFVAVRRRLTKASYVELTALIALPIAVAFLIAKVSEAPQARPQAPAAAAEPTAPSPETGTSLEIEAANLAFDTKRMTLAPQAPVTIEFLNRDIAPHNIAIYESEKQGRAQQDAIFSGVVVNGGDSATYDFEAPEEGQYYFQCDLHPNMNGTVVVR